MIDTVFGTVSDVTTISVSVKLSQPMLPGLSLRVLVPDPTLYRHNEEVRLYTHLLLSGAAAGDGEFKLYGFVSKPDRTMFHLLKSVSGVGGKAALAIMAKGLDDVRDAIAHGEPDGLKVKGVGPKTTKRIVDDLQKKVAQIYGVEARA